MEPTNRSHDLTHRIAAREMLSIFIYDRRNPAFLSLSISLASCLSCSGICYARLRNARGLKFADQGINFTAVHLDFDVVTIFPSLRKTRLR